MEEKLFKNTLYSGLSSIATGAVGFFLLPIIISRVGVVEYGLVGITLFSMIIFMAIVRMISIIRSKGDVNDRMIAVALISGISAYIFFMATSNTLLDKYFWLAITLAQIHYSVCNKTKEEMAL